MFTRNPTDAEDLVQDALVNALTSWVSFEPAPGMERDRAVAAWLQRILFNRFVSLYRKHARRGRMLEELSGETEVDEACRAAVPNARLVPGLWGDELERALGQLPEHWRDIVERVLLRDELHREVAGDLGIPLSTVLTRMHRARKRLTTELAGFAEREYGLVRRGVVEVRADRQDAGHHPPALEPAQAEQPQSNSVDRVVAGGDAVALGRRQAG